MFVFFKLFIYIFITLFMFGCVDSQDTSASINSPHKVIYKPTTLTTPVEESELLIMKDDKRKELIQQSENGYKIKAGDRVNIVVVGHPELSSSNSPGVESKTILNQNGTIQLPELGILNVLGMTTKQVKVLVTNKLKKILIEPDVVVNIVYVEQYRYNLVGEFMSTGVIEKKYQMSLLELIAMGKGINTKTADLKNAYVVRNQKKLPVNLYRLLVDGEVSQNIDMRDRDTVVIPKYKKDQFVYVFTKVSRRGMAKIPLDRNNFNLIQVLSITNLIETKEDVIDFKNVYVIRTEIDRIETFKMDAEKMFRGEVAPFELIAGDVVYVPKTKVGFINEVINDFVPILSFLYSVSNNIQAYRIVRDYQDYPQ